jgi:hypothetical protein
MSFWVDDIDKMMADFGGPVTLVNYQSSGSASSGNNSEITAIFDEAQRIIDFQDGQVVSAMPTVTAKTEDVENISRRSIVIINNVSYFVNEPLDDGTGITILILSEK